MALIRTTNSVGSSLADALQRRWDVVEFVPENDTESAYVRTLLRDASVWEAADLVMRLGANGRHAMVVQHKS